MKPEAKDSIVGRVTSRECPLCGHHEIGFVTQDGQFHSLRPGTLIRVGEPSPQALFVPHQPTPPLAAEEEKPAVQTLWTPEPLRGDRTLRVKYSVMAKAPLPQGEISGGGYERAYLEKLERLIEKTLDVPLPVVLDHYFSAPQLASGNPRQVAEAMYRELDELRRPVALMKAWLDTRDDRSLAGLIAPKSIQDLGQEPSGDETIREELERLSLEEFLAML